MKRTVLLIALFAVYVGTLAHGTAWRLLGASPFDPLSPRPREVEELIVASRFADALPLATELRHAYPAEPLIAFWLATINRELGQPHAEAESWEAYVRLSHAPAEACPAWPNAYARLGQTERARVAFERCAAFEHP